MLIRMPAADSYALKVPQEQALLPQLAKYLTLPIPTPLHQGSPSVDYPYPFSIYSWLPGKSLNLVSLPDEAKMQLALSLSHFLKELQSINTVNGLPPGQHNWWRGAPPSVYDQQTKRQIEQLAYIIDAKSALDLWSEASSTAWNRDPVWIHGDLALGNLLVQHNQLSAVIDFGGTALGDPACDLTIAWTYFSENARDVFIREMNLDDSTWLRAKAWALWKATYVLCQLKDLTSAKAHSHLNAIAAILR